MKLPSQSDYPDAKSYGEACARAALEEAAHVLDRAKPPGGRAWMMEQVACFDALDHCANFIRSIEVDK